MKSSVSDNSLTWNKIYKACTKPEPHMQMAFIGKKRNKFLQLIVSVASFLAGKYVLQAFHKVYIHIL